MLCYYEFKQRFYGLSAGRVIKAGVPTPWQRDNFMFRTGADERATLEAELSRMYKITPDSFIVRILEKMVRQERIWNSEAGK